MIVDTSAIIAILENEPEANDFFRLISTTRNPRMSVASVVELRIVVQRRQDPVLERRVEELLQAFNIKQVPVSVRQGELAREAFRAFGKGMGHPAQLNFGDCFSYALARELDARLLFKGNDFSQTDIRFATEP